MAGRDEPTREQLLEARAAILAQLEAIDFRASLAGVPGTGIGLPDYPGPAGELEDELRAIDVLLEGDDAPDVGGRQDGR